MNKMQPIPSLAILRSFEAAAKHQSFTAAAEELFVTQGAISRQVRELEAIIGVRLFRKAGRGVALTQAGRNLAHQLTHDLGRLRQTISHAAAAGEGGQSLSVAVLPTFSSRWLAPRLPRYCAAHPEVQLVLHSRSIPFDLAKEGIDIAIHFGRAEWVDGTLSQLCPENLVAVASPALLRKYQVKSPEDGARLPLLQLTTRRTAWRDYFDKLGVQTDGARQGALFDQFSPMIVAAAHGLGAVIAPTYLIENELARQELVTLGQPGETGDMYYVVQPKGVMNPIADDFAAWVQSEAQTSQQNRQRVLCHGDRSV